MSLPREVVARVEYLSSLFPASFLDSLVQADTEIDILYKGGRYIEFKEQHVLDL